MEELMQKYRQDLPLPEERAEWLCASAQRLRNVKVEKLRAVLSRLHKSHNKLKEAEQCGGKLLLDIRLWFIKHISDKALDLEADIEELNQVIQACD